MATPFTTTDQVIEALDEAYGGRKAVAKLLRRGPTAISNWLTTGRGRGKFPCVTYVIIQHLLQEANLPAAPASLWEMQLPQPEGRQP